MMARLTGGTAPLATAMFLDKGIYGTKADHRWQPMSFPSVAVRTSRQALPVHAAFDTDTESPTIVLAWSG
jgi:hypothetical protein